MLTDAILQLASGPISPIPLADEPFELLHAWFEDARARGKYAEPAAMCLATATPDGRPSVRMVLCKHLDRAEHSLTFFTNYESRKGRELAQNPHAAGVFYWPHAERQARVAGVVERLSDAESDAYFKTRPVLSQIGAVVSPQSRVIQGCSKLLTAAAKLVATLRVDRGITRPAHWGGYRLRATEVELWSACIGRLHQRVRWSREDLTCAQWTRDLLAP